MGGMPRLLPPSLSLCQSNGERVAVKVFAGSAEFKSLKREIDVVRSLPSHDNIVMLFGDEEEVSYVQIIPVGIYKIVMDIVVHSCACV